MFLISDNVIKQTRFGNIIIAFFDDVKKTVAQGAKSKHYSNTKWETLEANYVNFRLNDEKLVKYEFTELKDNKYFTGKFFTIVDQVYVEAKTFLQEKLEKIDLPSPHKNSHSVLPASQLIQVDPTLLLQSKVQKFSGKHEE